LKVYTIGFSGKSSGDFFKVLRQAAVKKVVDIRRLPWMGPGFARKRQLGPAMDALGMAYVHVSGLAPSESLLRAYRQGSVTWMEYEDRFASEMEASGAITNLERDFLGESSCLLCVEATPDNCHRRLVAEMLKARWPNLQIIHL